MATTGNNDGNTATSGSQNAQPQWLSFFQNNGAAMSAMMGQFASNMGASSNVVNGMTNLGGHANTFLEQTKSWNSEDWGNLDNKGKATNIMNASGAALGAIADFMPERDSISGEYGNLSQSTESMVDMVGQMPGMVGAIYNAANGLSDIAAGVFGDTLTTSGNSKSDAIMDAIPVLGLLNAGLGNLGRDNTVENLEYDKEAWNTVGGSYAGSQSAVKDAAENTGGRYGLIAKWTGEMDKDRDQNRAAAITQQLVSQIGDEAKAAQEVASSTLQEAILNEKNRLAGNKLSLRVQKGMKLPTKEDIQRTKNAFNYKIVIPQEVPDYTLVLKSGGKTDKKEEKPKTRSLEELIQYAKEQNPRFIQRMSEPLRYIRINTKNENGEDMWNHATHIMNQRGNIVYPMIQEINGKLHMFDNEDEAFEYAKATGNILNFNSEDEAKLFAISDKDENGNYFGYKLGWPEFFETSPIDVKEESSVDKFKEGGKMNIIPEGELHARLHHMEQEGITKKGIPVISEEEGGEIIQHAEIERNEIIFRLEVTKKLEELMEDGSEEAALEAGKLLVEEILNNTEDRTGLIDEVE